MEGFAPILIMAIFWLCIGLPLSKVKQAQKKQAASRQPKAQQAKPATESAPKQAAAPAAPRVTDPALRVPVTATVSSFSGHDDTLYQGSLNAVTGEGYDPCHDEDLSGLKAAEAAPVPRPVSDAPALPFGWTGSDMVRGIVVSEILKRRGTARR